MRKRSRRSCAPRPVPYALLRSGAPLRSAWHPQYEGHMSMLAKHVGPYERLVLLKAMTIVGNPPIEALAALAQQAGERHLAAGERMPGGQRGVEDACVVVEGRIDVLRNGELLYSAGPREGFGLLEVLARVGTGLEVRARTETLALELRTTTVLSVFEDHFIMTLEMLRSLGRMLLSKPDRLSASLCRREIPVPAIVSPG